MAAMPGLRFYMLCLTWEHILTIVLSPNNKIKTHESTPGVHWIGIIMPREAVHILGSKPYSVSVGHDRTDKGYTNCLDDET